jgi:hypothetical protein
VSRKTTRIRTCFCLPPQTGCAEGRALEAVGGSGRAAASPACRAEAQRRRKPSAAPCRVAAGRRREGRRNSSRAPNMFQPSRLPRTRQRWDCGGFSAALVRACSGGAPSSGNSRGLGSLRHPDSKGSRQLAKFADPLFRHSDFGPRILRPPLGIPDLEVRPSQTKSDLSNL